MRSSLGSDPLDVRRVTIAATATLVFVVTWLLRFNDPNGSFAGLTDDHFFYLVRGWQILYGDLPGRDFVDQGAPLYYYVAAAVQALFGRGTLSELAFSVTMIAAGSAMTFWLAARASGSVVLGLCGALVEIWLMPRFYNYPKILVYTVAIPLFWWFADRPGRWPRFWLAAVTAIAFLFRFDHGVFVAAAFAVLLALLRQLSWNERIRHAVVYGLLTIALLSPYLLFIQMNGGAVRYFEQAFSWATRERERTEIVWPGLLDYPDGISEETRNASALTKPVSVIRDNATAWWYYFELGLPFVAMAALSLSRDAFRPGWNRAVPKIGVVAALGLILDAGFLRSPLGARIADPSVPHAILLAWLGAAVFSMFRSRESWQAGLVTRRMPLAAAFCCLLLPFALVLGATMSGSVYDQFDNASLTEGLRPAVRRAREMADNIRGAWELTTWEHRTDRPELITLAMYLNSCTPPDARIFVQPYIPQVLALARRPFAGGHADLRTGFFDDEESQALTVQRLQRQDVQVALLGESPESFSESFSQVGDYLQQTFAPAATHRFDDRFDITLLLRKDAVVRGRFADLDWPCLQ
jgi:hypothetical protein